MAKSNGKAATKELNQTVPEVVGDDDETFKGGKAIARRKSTDVFTTPNSESPLKLVVESGENPRDLLMRSFIPSKKTEAYGIMLDLLTIARKCRKFHDDDGLVEVADYYASLVSLDGQGRADLRAVMIGGDFDDGNGGGGEGQGLAATLKRLAMGRGQ